MRSGTLETFVLKGFWMTFAESVRESRSCAEIATATLNGRWLSILSAVD